MKSEFFLSDFLNILKKNWSPKFSTNKYLFDFLFESEMQQYHDFIYNHYSVYCKSNVESCSKFKNWLLRKFTAITFCPNFINSYVSSMWFSTESPFSKLIHFGQNGITKDITMSSWPGKYFMNNLRLYVKCRTTTRFLRVIKTEFGRSVCISILEFLNPEQIHKSFFC